MVTGRVALHRGKQAELNRGSMVARVALVVLFLLAACVLTACQAQSVIYSGERPGQPSVATINGPKGDMVLACRDGLFPTLDTTRSEARVNRQGLRKTFGDDRAVVCLVHGLSGRPTFQPLNMQYITNDGYHNIVAGDWFMIGGQMGVIPPDTEVGFFLHLQHARRPSTVRLFYGPTVGFDVPLAK